MFNNDQAEAITIYTSSQGAAGAKVSLGTTDYNTAFNVGAGNIADATQAGTVVMSGAVSSNPGDALSISQVTSAELDTAYDNVANLRAQSGGKLSTLGLFPITWM